jgi:transposase
MTATIRSEWSVREATLYVALEISKREWKLAMSAGFGLEPWLRTVRGGDLAAVQAALAAARVRFGLSATARVIACHEAGPAGFWIHRALTQLGVASRIVDSASLEVNRRRRRAKTDRLDALQLLRQLLRVCFGERGVWSEVRVPTVAQEAARQVSRERTALVKEQTRLVNQLRGWLATWGTTLPSRRPDAWWTTVRDWAGAELPAELQARLARAHARLALVASQIDELDAQQAAAVAATGDADAPLWRLTRLKAVAPTSASILLEEGLVWRDFRNRRQIGGLLGFAPMPYNSGDSERDQGIGGAGNKRLQAVSIQLAWNWVRWQPDSALTRWYRARFGTGKRARRIGIVALARKLLIALWRYATQAVKPEGAILKSAATH